MTGSDQSGVPHFLVLIIEQSLASVLTYTDQRSQRNEAGRFPLTCPAWWSEAGTTAPWESSAAVFPWWEGGDWCWRQSGTCTATSRHSSAGAPRPRPTLPSPRCSGTTEDSSRLRWHAKTPQWQVRKVKNRAGTSDLSFTITVKTQ